VGTGLALFFVGYEPPGATAPDPVRGNLLATLSGVTWAFTIVGLRWLSDRGEGRAAGDGAAEGAGVRAVVAGNAIAALACLPWALPLGAHAATDWAVIAYLGVFQIGVAYLLVTSALAWVPAFEASVLLLVEPALNPIWSWLVHGEVPSGWAMLGGVVILGATVLRTWRDTRRQMAPVG
jgi:drug/metabolite transporter (DMT)-like permease